MAGTQLARGVLWYCHIWHELFVPVALPPADSSAASSVFLPLPLWLWGSPARGQTSLPTALVQWTGTGSGELAFGMAFLPHFLICGDAAFIPLLAVNGGMVSATPYATVLCHNTDSALAIY